MICQYCHLPNTFNMHCPTCIAKKVIRDGTGKDDRLRLINAYSVDLDIETVKSEVSRLFKDKNDKSHAE